MSDLGPLPGDGSNRLPLSEAISSIMKLLDNCNGDLEAIRHRLQQEDLPEELDVEVPEEPLDERAREVADRLEVCAEALRSASGETGEGNRL